jgi:NNP family nitrate/nitrite transporter-like MFS transporter
VSDRRFAPSVKATTALAASTLAFTLCFGCWVLNAVLVTHLTRTGTIPFSETEIGWLLAAPILTGALTRVPLGILTDRFGGRLVFSVVMLLSAVPMYLVSQSGTFLPFLLASLGFGLTGGTFAVGVAYVSLWFSKERQGVALGVFGLGNIGAALTTALAPELLTWATQGGANLEGWRTVPKVAAAALALAAVLFFIAAGTKLPQARPGSFAERLAPLKSAVVWRFGLYYFLVFGAFVTLAQWLIPYGVSVYELSVAQAGRLASLFSLPAAAVSLVGGYLGDKFGARPMMTWVFRACILVCVLLAVPRMDITSPGEGVIATGPGTVSAANNDEIVVGQKRYPLRHGRLEKDSAAILPTVASYQTPIVSAGAEVIKNQLLARGVTEVTYPANLWAFGGLAMLLGMAFGIGKAGVLKFIPEQFPNSVGAVGGMVGLLGALSGFFFPLLFGYLLRWTGLWTTCWIVLAILSVGCLVSMHLVASRILEEEAPDLAWLIERRPDTAVVTQPLDPSKAASMEQVLKGVPFFSDFSVEELKRLAELGGTQSVAAGDVIFTEGAKGDALYVVLSGTVRIHHAGPQSDVTLSTLGPGQLFGEMSLLDGEARSASATAASPVELFLVDRAKFLRLLAKSPRMVADLLVGLSGTIRLRSKDLAELTERRGTA